MWTTGPVYRNTVRGKFFNVIGVSVTHSRVQSITGIEIEHWLLAKRHVDIVNIRRVSFIGNLLG